MWASRQTLRTGASVGTTSSSRHRPGSSLPSVVPPGSILLVIAVDANQLEQRGTFRNVECLDISQAPRDRSGAAASLVDRALGGVELLAELLPEPASRCPAFQGARLQPAQNQPEVKRDCLAQTGNRAAQSVIWRKRDPAACALGANSAHANERTASSNSHSAIAREIGLKVSRAIFPLTPS